MEIVEKDREGARGRVVVTGSSGLIGRSLVRYLTKSGRKVLRLVRERSMEGKDAAFWDPYSGTIDHAAMEGVEAAVHLSGENIAGRWNRGKKEEIRRSRVDTTRFICRSLGTLERPPTVLVSASAVGYYGDRGDEVLTEESLPGSGFLADLCRDWEEAARPAVEAGIRVVNMRIGLVLSPAGGALGRMLRPFRLGLGGRIGSGRQYWSWISIDDLVAAVLHAIETPSLVGPVNAVAPHAATNREFARTLGRVLSRPAFLPLPAPLARILMGEAAGPLLLASARVLPQRLLASGFRFRRPTLEEALRLLLKEN
jgi:hypothetical protein